MTTWSWSLHKSRSVKNWSGQWAGPKAAFPGFFQRACLRHKHIRHPYHHDHQNYQGQPWVIAIHSESIPFHYRILYTRVLVALVVLMIIMMKLGWGGGVVLLGIRQYGGNTVAIQKYSSQVRFLSWAVLAAFIQGWVYCICQFIRGSGSDLARSLACWQPFSGGTYGVWEVQLERLPRDLRGRSDIQPQPVREEIPGHQ